jgi:hypothetical protein
MGDNETEHPLFIDFKQAYSSVILIVSGVPMILVRLIKMYLNKT